MSQNRVLAILEKYLIDKSNSIDYQGVGARDDFECCSSFSEDTRSLSSLSSDGGNSDAFSSTTTIKNINKSPYRYKNYCVIIENKKNYVVGESDNTKASGRHLSHDGKMGFSCHAEMDALNKFFASRLKIRKGNSPSRLSLKGLKVFSIRARIKRETSDFEISEAKPCLRCMLMLSKWGLSRNVFYSTVSGEIVECSEDEISSDESIHRNFRLSSGDRKELHKTFI